ncbi:MAG: phosphatase PAP2 family protein [Lachnospiraceae bacterium]|nr:phosphatase PAP2 family protein [Lachnospiraceae bacterium]
MDWEFSFLYFLQELHNPVLDKIMVFITSLGNDGLLWIGLAVLLVFFKKYRKCAISICISLILMELTGNVILKELIMRERPCWIDPTVELLIKAPSSYSFPSGHTFAGFASAVTVFLNHKKEGIAAIVAAVLIAFSRMYLFVHFPTDILGGMVFGIGVAVLTYFIVHRWWPKLMKKRNKVQEDK